jgi:hypothetical protein
MRTVLQHADRRQQAVTVLSEQDLEIVAGAAGKKGGTPEFCF